MSDPQPSIPDFLYGTAWKEERTPALVELALRTGFCGIDTANQRRHYFEQGVGQGLAAAYRAGVVTRADLFLQTKFTYRAGQDHRLPYDPASSLSDQVAQSLASSLDHLGTDHVDSFVLHGPSSGYAWSDADAEVWEAMKKERDAGRTRMLGVSNVSLQHLEQMIAFQREVPYFVMEGSPSTSDLKSANERLTQASHKLAEAMYKATAAQGAAPGGPSEPAAGGPSDGGSAGAGQKKEGEVIDAEYVDVDDKK